MKKFAVVVLSLALLAGLAPTASRAYVQDPLPADYPRDGAYYGHQLYGASLAIYNYLVLAIDGAMSSPVQDRAAVYIPIASNIAVKDLRSWNALIEKFNRDERIMEFMDGIPDALAAFRLDHPEVFWLESSSTVPNSTYLMRGATELSAALGGSLTYAEAGDGVYSYGIVMTFDVSEGWTGRNARSISGDRARLTGWVSQTPELMEDLLAAWTPADMLGAIHDWLVTHNCYNAAAASGADSSEVPWSPLSAVDESLSPVCEGYAKAFKLACAELGIPCVLITGDAYYTPRDGERHMWNAVVLNNRWYGVDVTWDDPATLDAWGSPEYRLYSGAENRRFFLVGSDVLYPAVWSSYTGRHEPNYYFISTVRTDEEGYPLDRNGRRISPLDPDAYGRMVPEQGNSDFLYPTLSRASYDYENPAGVPAGTDGGAAAPSPALSGEPETGFVDVPARHWAYDAVTYVTGLGLFGGTGGGRFSPDAPMSRAMLAQALYNLSPYAAPGHDAGFYDVQRGDWYADAVGWCADMGLMVGVGDGAFGADGSVTREQLAAILLRYAAASGIRTDYASDLNAFPDGWTVQPWAREAMGWTVAAGLIGGTDRGLEPQAPASRAQVAAILARFIDCYGLL